MSCSICHYITGHAPDCREGLADRQNDHEDLRARVDVLEQKLAQLENIVFDYAHLKKLYDESREYARTLEHERDKLVASGRNHVEEINRLDADMTKLRDALGSTRDFLLAVARRCDLDGGFKDLLDKAAAIGRVLDEVPRQ